MVLIINRYCGWPRPWGSRCRAGLSTVGAHECNNICNELNILEITNNNILSKRQIKSAVQKAITEQSRNDMLSFKEVADRVSGKSSDNNYLDRIGLTHSKI